MYYLEICPSGTKGADTKIDSYYGWSSIVKYQGKANDVTVGFF